jgi:hypothetical protein
VFYVGLRKLSGRKLKNHGALSEASVGVHAGAREEAFAMAQAALTAPKLGAEG